MKRVLWAAAVVAVLIVGYHVQRAARKPDRAEVQAAVDTAMDDLRAKAQKDHPEMALSDAMKATATEQAEKTLAGQGDAQRAQTAAGFYMGFHWSNTRVRKEYCDAQGVDIGAFVTAFENKHAQQHARAEAILAGQDLDQAYELIHAQITQAIEQDMRDVARGANVPVEQSCQLFVDNADAIVEFLVLPPAVSQALGA